MSAITTTLDFREIGVLLRGEAARISAWTERWEGRRVALQLLVIVVGAGSYGAAMGWWRDPLQAGYTAIKFPLIILLTTLGNALLNGMLAPLLGLNLPFRQSSAAMLMSFTIATAILGSFSPLIIFLIWNTGPLTPGNSNWLVYCLINLTHVAVIAFAGVMGNLRLFQLLQRFGGSRAVAFRVLLAWLAGNLLMGSQLSWILRPFIGAPGLPVEFVRPNALQGNFFESVLLSLQTIFHSH